MFGERRMICSREPPSARAVDAIRFAIEELPPELLFGTCREVDEQRYGSDAIHRLYQSGNYSIAHRAVA
jgi:hypothetical protein